MSKIEAGHIVGQIIEDLSARSALGLAWERLDDSKRNEIKNAWIAILLNGVRK